MDVEHAEMAEKQLDILIGRRSRKGDVDPDEQEELWKASVRAYNRRRQEERRAAWASYHEGQAERHRRTLRELIDYHETQAERLLTEGEAPMTEGNETTLGTTGLSYGTQVAEEMIEGRIKKLGGRGYPDARSAAIGQLAAEGNLKTKGEVGTHERYLGEEKQRELAKKRAAAPASYESAKAEAKRRAEARGIPYNVALSEVMNEKASRGEVKL